MGNSTIRTSTIFVAFGDQTSVYKSMAEVPEPIRQKLQATTASGNAATILIADRNGREELVRAIKGLPSQVRFRVAATKQHRAEPPKAPEPPPKPTNDRVRTVVEFGILGLLALSAWLLVIYR